MAIRQCAAPIYASGQRHNIAIPLWQQTAKAPHPLPSQQPDEGYRMYERYLSQIKATGKSLTLDIQVYQVQLRSIGFNELTSGGHPIAHQHRKDAVSFCCILNLNSL